MVAAGKDIASRAAGFIFKRFEGRVSNAAMNDEILTGIRAAAEDIRNDYENREYARAMRRVMELADVINEYVDREKPWELAKNPETADKLQYVASVALEGFRLLTLYLKPVLPTTTNASKFFRKPAFRPWCSTTTRLPLPITRKVRKS